MTVNRIAPPFPVSDTGQPWPNPIVVNFEVVERVVGVNLMVDTNRDGSITDSDDQGEENLVSYTANTGALILPNLDDDDVEFDGELPLDDTSPDAKDAIVNGADDVNDLGKLSLKKLNMTSIPDDFSFEFKLTKPQGESTEHASVAAKDRVRVFGKRATDGIEILGPTAGDTFTFSKSNASHAYFFTGIAGSSGYYDLGIEGIEPGMGVTVEVTMKKGTQSMGSDKVTLLVAPVLITSNTDTTTKKMVSKWAGGFAPDQSAFFSDFPTADNELAPSAVGGYIQDPLEIGFSALKNSSGQYASKMNILLGIKHTLWGDDYGVYKLRNNVGYYQLNNTKNSHNMGGNFEGIPAFGSYTLGTVIASNQISSVFTDFIKKQGV